MNAELLAQVCSLSESERLELIEEIWDSLSPEDEEDPGTLHLSPEQIEELDRRAREHLRDPSSAIPWATVQERMRERFGIES